VLALKVALAKSLFTPPQLQHWPETLVVLTFVHAAVQLPVVVVPSGFRP
jgi:hypothetical protein